MEFVLATSPDSYEYPTAASARYWAGELLASCLLHADMYGIVCGAAHTFNFAFTHDDLFQCSVVFCRCCKH